MMMDNIKLKKLTFIDITTSVNHKSIKNRAIGASEYQCYNLMEKLSHAHPITCYNLNKNIVNVDNILYKSFSNDLLNDDIEINSVIIVQRMLPNVKNKIYNKIKNNKILLWIHDLVEMYVFMCNYNSEEQTYYKNNERFRDEILREFYENKNINFIFVSNFIKYKFVNYFKNYGFIIEQSRLHVIYNIMYEEEYAGVKNDIIPVNKNYITYASAWQKGIEHVISVFDYAKKYDRELKLVLLSPGYDWNNWTSYANDLKQKYGKDVIIHGPVDKLKYSRIIKESLVVLSTIFEETFGCVFAESYYLGTPVIADHRSGAIREIIDNNFIVNFDNKEETFNKIMEVKNNRNNMNVHLNAKFGLEENLKLWNSIINYKYNIDKVKNFRGHYNLCEGTVKKYIEYIKNSDILDIGSNVGFFSEAIIKNTTYKSIHLFEPSKEYYEHGKHLLQHYNNIYFNNYGLSDTEDIRILYKSPTDNIGWNTFLEKDPNQPNNFIDYMTKEECILKKLDDYEIDNIDFIKIDVEGFENQVLKGGMNLISKYKPYILIEVGWGTNHPNWKDCEKQYNKLFELGYKKVIFKDYTEDVLFEPI